MPVEFSDQFVSNVNLLSQAERELEGKPAGLVANRKGTTLYHKDSAWGRVWTVLHFVLGTGDSALARTVQATAKTLGKLASDRALLCDSTDPKNPLYDGPLGAYWRSHSVAEMRELAECHVGLSGTLDLSENTIDAVEDALTWAADHSSDGESVEMQALALLRSASFVTCLSRAAAHIENAVALDAEWSALGGDGIASLGMLFRELKTVYPSTDQQLIEKRDSLQEQLGYKLGGEGFGWYKADAKPELLYGPLVKVAFEVGRTRGHRLDEYQQFFDQLISATPSDRRESMRATAQKILDVAQYFRDSTLVPTTIPQGVVSQLANEPYVASCGLKQTDALSEADCYRVGGGTRPKVVFIPHSGPPGDFNFHTMVIEERIPVQHCRTYYRYVKGQDGADNLTTFSTLSPTAG